MPNEVQKIAVAGFLVVDNRALIVRRSQKETFLPGYYELPGGKVDFDENPDESLEREFFEETNLKVKALRPYKAFSYTTNKNTRHTVEIVYLVKLIGEKDEVRLSEAHDDYQWVTEADINRFNLSDVIKANVENGFKTHKVKDK